MPKLLALLALLLLSACSSRPDRIPLDATVAISPQFDAETTESLMVALSAWEAASDHRFRPTLRIGDYAGCALYIHPGEVKGTALGSTRSESNDTADMTIDVAKTADSKIDLVQVAEHEIGHAFGLEHEADTVMCTKCVWNAGIDPVTIGRFEENYR